MYNNLFTDEYVKGEIRQARQWMGKKGHSLAEWDGFTMALSMMYLHCSEEMRIAAQAIFEEAERREQFHIEKDQ